MQSCVHLVRLEHPGDAMRTTCGASRSDVAWTTSRDRVTCPRCQVILEAHRPLPSPQEQAHAAKK